MAKVEDPCFAEFEEDSDYFLHTFPISESANTLIKHMLGLDPLARSTLPEIREEILKVDSFFLTEDELKSALPNICAAAEYYRYCVAAAAERTARGVVSSVNNNPSNSVSNSDFDTDSSDSYDSEMIFAIPDKPLQQSVSRHDLVYHAIFSHDLTEFSIGSDPGSDSTDSTTDDSEGPITPEIHAVGLDIEVPDLPEGQSLNKPDVVQVKLPTKRKSSPFTTALHKALRIFNVTH
jgi:serine/threonine protein kinase